MQYFSHETAIIDEPCTICEGTKVTRGDEFV
jgi:hypothetical protein